MIQIVRITGETVDLEDLTESPSSLVLSNGLREVAVDAPKELLEMVIELRVEQIQYMAEQDKVSVKEVIDGLKGPDNPPQAPRIRAVAPVNPKAGSPTFEPSEEPEEEDEKEPGEEYSDQNTGVASI